jgi:hypothetical protein
MPTPTKRSRHILILSSGWYPLYRKYAAKPSGRVSVPMYPHVNSFSNKITLNHLNVPKKSIATTCTRTETLSLNAELHFRASVGKLIFMFN